MNARWGLLVLALALNGCSTFGGGKSNIEPPTPLKPITARANVSVVWSHQVGKGPGKKYVLLSPVADDGVVYAAEAEGSVAAYGANDGKRRWRVDLKQPIEAATGYGDGLVLVGTRAGKVVALHKEDGKLAWGVQASSEILAAPVARDGIVLVQTIDGKLSALSARDGAEIWTVDRTVPALSLRGTSRPIIVANAAVTGFASGHVLAVDMRSGRVLSDLPVAEPRGRNEIERLVDVDASPVVNGGAAYAAAYQGRIVCFDIHNGQLLWSKDVSTYAAMDSDARNLYVTDEHGVVWALDLRTGQVMWKQDQLRGRTPSGPLAVGDYVVVGDYQGYVHYLAKDDGAFVARYRLDSSAIKSQPVAADEIALFLDQGGELAALRAVPLKP